jgi:hypothetical protein
MALYSSTLCRIPAFCDEEEEILIRADQLAFVKLNYLVEDLNSQEELSKLPNLVYAFLSNPKLEYTLHSAQATMFWEWLQQHAEPKPATTSTSSTAVKERKTLEAKSALLSPSNSR